MRPLNRPMFRYGGPIKEGIMDGMKDSPQQLVKSNADGSRPGYAGPLAIPVVAGLNALRIGATAAARRAIPKIANFFRTQVGTKTVPKQGPTGIGPVKVTRGPGGTVTRSSTKLTPGTGEAPIFAPTYLGRDPTVKLVGGIGKAVMSPTAKGIGGKAAQFVFSPTGIVTGAYFAGGKFFDKDGNEIPEDVVQEQGLTTGRQFTGDEAMVGDPRQSLPDSKPKTNQDDLTKDRIQKTKERYYKLMGLDDMKKDAVYDSLIDASKIVQEEGADLKGAIKSGTLQNRIIQAISGQLDKSAALKKQIDAAVLKGEIEKDIAGAKPGSYLKQAEDYAAMKGVSVSQAYQDLGFDKRGDLNEGVQLYLKTNKVAPAGNDLATLARSYEIDIAGIEDTTTVKNKMKDKGYDEVGYLNEILSNPNANVKPGNYVINNRVLNVDADKNITPVF